MDTVIERHVDDLAIPTKVKGRLLLGAIAMMESHGGRNWQPNFEPAFWRGGRYWGDAQKARADTWGQQGDPVMEAFTRRAVACSWGPWQILYTTADELGYQGPPWGLTDPDTCLHWAIQLINRRIAPGLDNSLEVSIIVRKLADGYNSGSHKDRNVPHRYIQDVWTLYSNPDQINLAILQDFT